MSRYTKGYRGAKTPRVTYTVALPLDDNNPRCIEAHKALDSWKRAGRGESGVFRDNVVNAVLLYIQDPTYAEALQGTKSQQAKLNTAVERAFKEVVTKSLVDSVVRGVVSQLQITGHLGTFTPQQTQALVDSAQVNHGRELEALLKAQADSAQYLNEIEVEDD